MALSSLTAQPPSYPRVIRMGYDVPDIYDRDLLTRLNQLIYKGNTVINEGLIFVNGSAAPSLEIYVSNVFPALNTSQVAAVVNTYSSVKNVSTPFDQSVLVQSEGTILAQY